MNRGTVPFYGRLEPQFPLDGLGTVFTAILAAPGPWRPCTPFEYMKHEGHEKFFFMFYVITYGVTLWDCAGGGYRDDVLFLRDAYAGDAAVDYAYPVKGGDSGKPYISVLLLGGAAFAFIGMIFILTYGTTSVLFRRCAGYGGSRE